MSDPREEPLTLGSMLQSPGIIHSGQVATWHADHICFVIVCVSTKSAEKGTLCTEALLEY